MSPPIIAIMVSMVLVCSIISLSVGISGSSLSYSTGRSSGATTYPSFTFEYPFNWTDYENVTLMSPQSSADDMTPDIIVIQTESLPPGTTLSEYTQSGINQLASLSYQDLSIIDSSPTTLAGLPAHTVTHTFTTEDGINLQGMLIWTVDNSTDTAYIISYGTTVDEFSNGLPVLQSIADTFQLQNFNDSKSGMIEGN